jgi:hypothetical protein
MKILKYDESTIRKLSKKNKKILIIADFSCVDYEDEDKQPENILAKELSLDFYPVFINPMQLMESGLIYKYYHNCEYWFVFSTIYKYFV